MKKVAYAVYDSKSKFFTAPFCCANDMVALRLFSAAVNDPATDVSKFPTDYTLFRVGHYDDEHGLLTPISPLENLGLASQFVNDRRNEAIFEAANPGGTNRTHQCEGPHISDTERN